MGDALSVSGNGPLTPQELCPVPPAQLPIKQYEELRDSWFFAWPTQTFSGLLQALTLSWLLTLPVTVLVASGSFVLRPHPIQLLLAAAVGAVGLPALLLVRQWLGWSSIHQRLLSEKVEYEESGWYDGQVWEKPLSWRQQDLLVAQHQVQPMLSRIRRALVLSGLIVVAGTWLWQAL